MTNSPYLCTIKSKQLEDMSKIALGTWAWGAGAFGGDAVFGSKTDVENLKPVFDTAMKAGLNLWDTATVYGMGESEKILGTFVAGEKRETVEVSTKFTPQLAEMFDNNVEKMADASIEDPPVAVGQGEARGRVESQHQGDSACQRDSRRGWLQGECRTEPFLITLPFIRERWRVGLLQGERHRVLGLHGTGAGSTLW